jgi:cobalt transporter subunit CbtB
MKVANTLETAASVHADQARAETGLAGRVIAAVCVGMIGLGLVWAASFANAEMLHNAAHDSRHSLAFPCH